MFSANILEEATTWDKDGNIFLGEDSNTHPSWWKFRFNLEINFASVAELLIPWISKISKSVLP